MFEDERNDCRALSIVSFRAFGDTGHPSSMVISNSDDDNDFLFSKSKSSTSLQSLDQRFVFLSLLSRSADFRNIFNSIFLIAVQEM